MRNILEATNKYKQRKTNSFSGKTETNRSSLSGNYLTGNKSIMFSMAVLSSSKNTATSFSKASGYESPGCLVSFISPIPIAPRLSHMAEPFSLAYTLKPGTNKHFSYSGAITACCRIHKNNINIDCNITPESILNRENESVNQVTACTLGEVPVMSDYLTEFSLFQRASGIRPAIRGLD
ncbi:MAG: hypothetical protein AB9834_07495 [Lentimicrobium sp.]